MEYKKVQLGEIVEAKVLAKLVSLGYKVSVPFGYNCRYDLVVEDTNGTLLKAQIKAGKYKDGTVRVTTKSVDNVTYKTRYYVGEVDIFLVWCPQLDVYYWIPAHDIVSGIYLRVDPPKTKQVKGIKWARDYII